MADFAGGIDKEFKGTAWENPQILLQNSPVTYAKNFKTPMLVIHGERDYRVPYTQGLQMYTALQKMNVPSKLIVFPSAGHWPAWHEMAFYYDVHLDFFHQYLGGEPAPYDVKEHARNLVFEKKSAKP